MESLYLLIPLGLLAVVAILALLWWSIYSGQFEDLEGPAHSILFDDDTTSDKKRADHLSDTKQ